MSTATDHDDIIRRRLVSSRAELTVEATMASMLIRAVAHNPKIVPGQVPMDAVKKMLNRLETLAEYRADGQLQNLVDPQQVIRDSLELLQVMASAGRDEETPTHQVDEPAFPTLDTLLELRSAVQIDPGGHNILVLNREDAMRLADRLDNMGAEVLSSAVNEDRGRTASYAVH